MTKFKIVESQKGFIVHIDMFKKAISFGDCLNSFTKTHRYKVNEIRTNYDTQSSTIFILSRTPNKLSMESMQSIIEIALITFNKISVLERITSII